MKSPLMNASLAVAAGFVTAFGAIPASAFTLEAIGSTQAVVVVTDGWSAASATGVLIEKTNGSWKQQLATPMVVGRKGLGWGQGLHSNRTHPKAPTKKEGDGKAPAGVFALGATAYGRGPQPPMTTALQWTAATGNVCVDDVKSPQYNRIVSAKNKKGTYRSAEKMRRKDALYDVVIVVDHNGGVGAASTDGATATPTPGKGSCIFLHVWRRAKKGTAGCTAMPKKNIVRLLGRIDPKARPVLISVAALRIRTPGAGVEAPSVAIHRSLTSRDEPMLTSSNRPHSKPLPLTPIAVVAIVAALAAGPSQAQPPLVDIAKNPGLVDAKTVVKDLRLDFRYATTNNFVGENVYGDFKTCFLQKDAADMLARANAVLKKRRKDLVFLAYDCLRPRSVQLKFWEKVVGTKQQSYVANPHSKTGSIHNYGCAIDLSIATEDGTPLDMGTEFDHFGARAHPAKEAKFVANGKLTHAQLANRLLLREVMVRAGFYPLSNEWWHFNCATSSKTRRKYKIVP